MAPIDPDASAIAARNLVENTLKHGAPMGLCISSPPAGGAVRVRSASGLVAEGELAHLGQPFVRGATAADGSALGLSIACSILEQAGGAMTLNFPASGTIDGFEAVVMLSQRTT